MGLPDIQLRRLVHPDEGELDYSSSGEPENAVLIPTLYYEKVSFSELKKSSITLL